MLRRALLLCLGVTFSAMVWAQEKKTPSPEAATAASFSVDGAGAVTAASFSGDGSALTNLSPASLATGSAGIDITGTAAVASDVNCTGCVSEGELDFDPATQSELDAHKTSGDHDGDYVDISGDSMNGSLSVDGDVSVSGDFLFDAPRTFYKNVPGSLFVPTNNTDVNLGRQWNKLFNYIAVFGAASFPNSTGFLAPVDLPDGAIIVNVTLYCYDNAMGGDATFNLFVYRRDLTATLVEGVLLGGGGFSKATSGASTSIQSASQIALSGREVIDNQNYMYEMSASIMLATVASQDLRFYGARIEYTLAGPAE